MKKIITFLLLSLLILGCKSSGTAKKSSKRSTAQTSRINNYPNAINNSATADKIAEIIEEAEKYEGVKYKYGGTSKKGMDCSGLVTTAFISEGIVLPRTTGAMANTGDWIDVKEVREGDLLFFATKKNSRTVNHVGLVTNAKPGLIEFIHSTTSLGVITSKLSEKYWYFAFVQARRIL